MPGLGHTADDLKLNPLTPEEERIIIHKGTEAPFTGEYDHTTSAGTYICRRCNAPLYQSESKFDSGCGWPAFDDEIAGAVKRIPDRDGQRTEIVCARCGAHLGHVFVGEHLTAKNTRHCVNSISMRFIPKGQPLPGRDSAATSATATSDALTTAAQARTTHSTAAIFASGCFWGTQYMLKRVPGVLSTSVGYTGGHTSNPTYQQVCSGTTGHVEALQVTYDPEKTNYETLARTFFETHDPTQTDGQGPDLGEQYHSVIFYADAEQKQIAEKLIGLLEAKGLKVATELRPASKFWPAEEYHQDYYAKNGKQPYCHAYHKLF